MACLILRNGWFLTLNLLQERGVDFIRLTENIDTTTPGSKLIFHLMGALAEFERDLIWERTLAGLAAAKTGERVGGRPRKTLMGRLLLRSISTRNRSIRSLKFVPCLN